MNLQLSLKTNWFNMTKKNIKKEDYRDITPYWIKRLTYNEIDLTIEDIEYALCAMRDGYTTEQVADIYGLYIRPFKTNTMTLGYPKKTDNERILKLEHKGISVGFGNPEWGADPNKVYFIIKHGAILNES